MDPIFAGYFPIRPVPVPDGLHLPGVEIICSASHCIVEVPEDWIDVWKHNDLGFYDTKNGALKVAHADGGQFEVFGYRVFPVLVSQSAVEDYKVPVSPAEDLRGFVRLGIDVVTAITGFNVGCSPLSCNGGAQEYETNKFCLLDELPYALDVAAQMDALNYEPGPYNLVEVWRSERTS
jgi:hypothetical protein